MAGRSTYHMGFTGSRYVFSLVQFPIASIVFGGLLEVSDGNNRQIGKC